MYLRDESWNANSTICANVIRYRSGLDCLPQKSIDHCTRKYPRNCTNLPNRNQSTVQKCWALRLPISPHKMNKHKYSIRLINFVEFMSICETDLSKRESLYARERRKKINDFVEGEIWKWCGWLRLRIGVSLSRLSKRMQQLQKKKSKQRASHQIVTANQCACASDRIDLIYVQFAHCAIVMISDCRHVIMYMRAIIGRSA